MADLAGVIQRGTAAQGSTGTTLSSQAASIQQGASQKVASGVAIERNAMQQKAMDMQMQGMVDAKNDVLFMGMENLQKQTAAAQKAMDDLPIALPEGTDVTTPLSKAMLGKMAGEREKAKTAHQAQVDRRNDYVLNIMRSPQAVAMLKKGSLADSYVAEQLLSPDIFESMNPAEQEEVIARVTAMKELETQAQSEQAGIQLQSIYREEAVKAAGKAAGEGGSLESTMPDASFLSEDAYLARFDAKGASEADKTEYWATDIQPLTGQAKKFQDMNKSDQKVMTDLLESWDPTDVDSFGARVLDFIDNKKVKSQVALDVLGIIESLGDEKHNAERIGEVINVAKAHMKPTPQFMFGGY